MKLRGVSDSAGNRCMLLFWCPGCRAPHPYRIALEKGQDPRAPVWHWNGDTERPTFSPSLLVDGGGPRRCHLFLKNGMLEFCADSRHELAGKAVPCPDWDEDGW